MKKLLVALAFAGLAFSVTSQAQSADTKLEWATNAVALQQGPELDRLIGQLAESSSQAVVQSWGGRMRANDIVGATAIAPAAANAPDKSRPAVKK